MNTQSHPEAADCEQGSTSEEQFTGDSTDSKSSLKLHALPRKIQEKTKQILHVNKGNEIEQLSKDAALPIIENDPAFHPTKLNSSENLDQTDKKTADGSSHRKAGGILRSIATGIIHPKESIKSKATKATAAKLSATQRPYLSQEADLNLLDAHKGVCSARPSSRRTASNNSQAGSIIKDCQAKFHELEAHRQSLQVAWTTSRHVSRVRVVPKQHIEFPDQSYFVERDAQDRPMRFDLLRWLGYNLVYYTQQFSSHYIDDFDELPFDKDFLRHHVERVVMASAPWQSWAMNVRSVYRWENPQKTGRWLALYFYLWYTNHIVAFLWAYIIYIVVKNRYFPTSITSMQDSTQRAHDREGTAYKFGELIDRHGKENWLEPLIDDLGPHLQLQIGDIANLLEVFNNFYHWKAPRKTAASLFFFSSCLLVALFADMAFCVKIVGFVAGGGFFLCWPISSLHPKYRYLVSPFKWVFWDIPTDAEWSFHYLRRQAEISRERMIKDKVGQDFLDEIAGLRKQSSNSPDPTTPQKTDEDWHSASSSASILDSSDILGFRAYSQGSIGHLIIYSSGLRFEQSLTKRELWRRPFPELVEMNKPDNDGSRSWISRLTKNTTTSLGQLELKFTDGQVLEFEAMKDRDGAFNSIIGFSALKWQSLQLEGNSHAAKAGKLQR